MGKFDILMPLFSFWCETDQTYESHHLVSSSKFGASINVYHFDLQVAWVGSFWPEMCNFFPN